MTTRMIAALAAVLMLAACGGGGGGGKTAMAPTDSSPPPAETKTCADGSEIPADQQCPAPEPVTKTCPDGSQVLEDEACPAPPPDTSAILQERLDAADTVTSFTSFFGDSIDTRETQPKPSGLELEDIRLWWADLLEPLGDRRGVSRAFFEVREETRSSAVENRFNYAGWMEHGFFALATSSIVIDNPLNLSEDVTAYIHSVGDASGSNPASGTATWTGIMAGVDLRSGDAKGNLVEGDATLTIGDFARPAVDLRFTNISDQHTGAALDDMVWSGIPLSAGHFSGRGLQGHFYGPDHDEVGGTFAYGNAREHLVVGAFGALRE